jgi:hypothetical protein
MRAFSYHSVLSCFHEGSLEARFLLTWLCIPLLHVWMTIQTQGQVRTSRGTRRRIQQITAIIARLLCIEGSPLTGQNDTSSGIWMHRYLGFGKPTQDSPYMITIGFFPNFSCPYFKEMVTKALSKRGHWVNCKHL